MRLPERLAEEPQETAIFADEAMREALIRRAPGLAGRLLPLEALGGGEIVSDRAVICALTGAAGARAALAEKRPDIPVRVLADDYLLAVAAGLDPWTDLDTADESRKTGRRYAVVCLPRSGSTYFCHLLQGVGTVARPTEHLRPHIVFLAGHRRETGFDIVRWMSLVMHDNAEDGLFGTKVIADFAAALWPHLDESQCRALERDWSDAGLVHLERQDKVGQAVSQFIADETRVWHVRNPGDEDAYTERKRSVVYDGERIKAAYERFQDDEARLRSYVKSRSGPILHVTYEDLVADVQKVVSETVAFINGKPPSPVDLTHEKYFPMSDDVNSEFAERFRRDLAREGGS